MLRRLPPRATHNVATAPCMIKEQRERGESETGRLWSGRRTFDAEYGRLFLAAERVDGAHDVLALVVHLDAAHFELVVSARVLRHVLQARVQRHVLEVPAPRHRSNRPLSSNGEPITIVMLSTVA